MRLKLQWTGNRLLTGHGWVSTTHERTNLSIEPRFRVGVILQLPLMESAEHQHKGT